MKYYHGNKIEPRLSTAWLIKNDRKQRLLILDKAFDMDSVYKMLKDQGERRFEIFTIDVGEFNLDKERPLENSYSSDARGVDQDMNIVL